MRLRTGGRGPSGLRDGVRDEDRPPRVSKAPTRILRFGETRSVRFMGPGPANSWCMVGIVSKLDESRRPNVPFNAIERFAIGREEAVCVRIPTFPKVLI